MISHSRCLRPQTPHRTPWPLPRMRLRLAGQLCNGVRAHMLRASPSGAHWPDRVVVVVVWHTHAEERPHPHISDAVQPAALRAVV